MNLIENATEEKKGRLRLPFAAPSKPVIIGICVVLGIFLVIFGAAGAVRLTHNDRVLPGVSYAGIDLGGMDRLAASETIQRAVDAMLDSGLRVTVGGKTETFAMTSESVDIAYSLIDVDVAAGVDAVVAEGKGTSPIGLLNGLLLATFSTYNITPDVVIDETKLNEMISASFADMEDPGLPTDFVIAEKNGTFTIDIVEGETGKVLAIDEALQTLAKDGDDLRLATLTVDIETIDPEVSAAQAQNLKGDVEAALANAPYLLTYTPENRTAPLEWSITKGDLMTWLMAKRNDNGEAALTIGGDGVTEFFAGVHEAIDVAPQDARFAMEGSKVVEFAGSREGVTVNDTMTAEAIVAAFPAADDASVQVAVDRVAPTVTTANVNSLGITEVLGVGTSSYKGSPSNRIRNIEHGASKLNGVLVAPGETISLVEKLGPFTVADGYLPELVIKGDEIKPEVGGGLCQIGTTTFRAVMNSGLKVVERRNHSLVVSYYNDLSNGNPGTDATIYDPAPDFKFMNDTANYILLTTEMDAEEQMLYFTFWGTSDGRKGSYEPPQVLSWSGYGATQYTETDTLAPGVEKCQAPHPGATTTFTYSIEYPDGTTYEEEFFSSYRSLPKICLVGRDPDAATETPSTTDPSIETENTASDTITPVAE